MLSLLLGITFDAHASRETFASPMGSLGLELFVSDG